MAVMHGLHLQDGEIMLQAVVAHMVAKGTFGLEVRQDVTADAEIRLGQHRQGQTAAVMHGRTAAPQQAREAQFRQAFGQGHDRRHGEGRRPAHEDVHRQALAPLEGLGMVHADAAMDLVMQAHLVGGVVVARQLHTVHAQIGGIRAGACGILAVDQRQGDEGAAVHGPAHQTGQGRQGAAVLQHGGLGGAAGQHVRQRGQGPQAAQGMLQGRGRIGLGGQHGFHPGEAVAKNVVQALRGAEKVGQHGEGAALDPREQQGRRLGAEGPALDVRQLQIRVHGHVDTAQLPDLFQIGHTFLKVTVAHQSSSPAGSTGASVRSPASQRPKSARMRAWSKQMGCGSLSRG